MSDTSVMMARLDARQALVRVWTAISAVWVAFWMLMALVAAASADVLSPLAGDLGSFSLIVLIPPFALLAAGLLAAWTMEIFGSALLRAKHRQRSGS